MIYSAHDYIAMIVMQFCVVMCNNEDNLVIMIAKGILRDLKKQVWKNVRLGLIRDDALYCLRCIIVITQITYEVNLLTFHS